METNNYSILMDTKSFILMLQSNVYNSYTIEVLVRYLKQYFSTDKYSIEVSDRMIFITSEFDIEHSRYTYIDMIHKAIINFFKDAIIQSRILAAISIAKKHDPNNAKNMQNILDRIIFCDDPTVIDLLCSIIVMKNSIQINLSV